MSTPAEDDRDAIPDDELLDLPSGAIPQGWLSEFFGRRTVMLHQQDIDELALGLSGDSTRHPMIFPGMDPKEKRHREEEARRRSLQADRDKLAPPIFGVERPKARGEGAFCCQDVDLPSLRSDTSYAQPCLSYRPGWNIECSGSTEP